MYPLCVMIVKVKSRSLTMLTQKEEKALARQIEAMDEEIEEQLAPLQKIHNDLVTSIQPIKEQIAINSAKMDAIKAPITTLHLKMRQHRKEQEEAVKNAAIEGKK